LAFQAMLEGEVSGDVSSTANRSDESHHVGDPGSTAKAEKYPEALEGHFSSANNTPTSFAKGRYEVTGFLGEAGKKKVYLAHDTTLDRDIAFG